jgi:hypothetical protein
MSSNTKSQVLKEDKKVGIEAKEKVRFNKMQKNMVFIYFHIVYIFYADFLCYGRINTVGFALYEL